MKKINCIWMVLLCLFLSACSSTPYERDTSKGSVSTITLEEMASKMENGDTFIVTLSQELCGACAQYHKMLNTYLENHNVTMYEVNLTAEPLSESQNLEIIHRYFPTFRTTPGIYYASEGKVVNSLSDEKKEVNEALFDEWVQEYELDSKK
ncbi:hypothetical protein [Amedibacillus sp. YH-ame10]